MRIIEENNLKILKAEEGKLLRDKNDNGEVLEDGTIIEPYRTDTIYLGIQVQTLAEAEEIYIEEDAEV